MQSLSSEMQTKITDILALYPVSRAAIFGSFARSEATDQSDIDILVDFYQPVGARFFGLKQDIEEAIERPVDLFRYADIMRSDKSQYVLKEATTIYVR